MSCIINLVYFIYLITLSFGSKLELDSNSDIFSGIIDVSCQYSENLIDFWAWGCETIDSESPLNSIGGYWSPCHIGSCSIIYFTELEPRAKNIKILGKIVGKNSFISVNAQNSITNPNLGQKFLANFNETLTWTEHIISLEEVSKSHAINITLEGGRGGFVIVDKIIFDFGDDVIDPTTEPEVTTVSPATKIILDKSEDAKKEVWNSAIVPKDSECTYAEEFNDLEYVWNCPAFYGESGEGARTKSGFWTNCRVRECSIIYFDYPTKPTSVKIYGFVKGDAMITVSSKLTVDVNDTSIGYDHEILRIGSGAQGYFEGETTKEFFSFQYDFTYALNFTITGGNNGYALIERIEILNQPALEDTTTSRTTSNPESTTEGAASYMRPFVLILLLPLTYILL